MKYVTMNLKQVPNETLFKYSEHSPFTFVRAGQRAYGVKQTGPYTYAWDGVSIGTISSYPVYVLGRLAGFEPPMDTNNIPLFQQQPYTPPRVDGTQKGTKKGTKKKRSKPVSETCSCAKPTKPAVDGAQEDVVAVAKQVKAITAQLARLRREIEEGPKPRKSRKAAPAPVPSYDEDMPF